MIIQVPDSSIYQVETPFLAAPHHICPTVNLYEKAQAIRKDEISGYWRL